MVQGDHAASSVANCGQVAPTTARATEIMAGCSANWAPA